MEQQPPKYIKVAGQLYRRAAKDISVDDVKESISKAADKAAIQNIVTNLIAHGGHVQEAAAELMEVVEDKNKAEKAIDQLQKHCDVMQKFLEQLKPTHARYVQKHPGKKKPNKKNKKNDKKKK